MTAAVMTTVVDGRVTIDWVWFVRRFGSSSLRESVFSLDTGH